MSEEVGISFLLVFASNLAKSRTSQLALPVFPCKSEFKFNIDTFTPLDDVD